MGSESQELRMVPIAFGLASQHGPGEQRLAPEGDEALWIQVPGMNRPESHRFTPSGPPPVFDSKTRREAAPVLGVLASSS